MRYVCIRICFLFVSVGAGIWSVVYFVGWVKGGRYVRLCVCLRLCGGGISGVVCW